MAKLKGLSFPLKFSPIGSLSTSEGIEKIKENIQAIVLTAVNERVMNPSIGAMGYEYLMRNLQEPEVSFLKHELRLGIESGESRVVVLDINIDQPELDGKLLISLNFKLDNSNEYEDLTFFV